MKLYYVTALLILSASSFAATPPAILDTTPPAAEGMITKDKLPQYTIPPAEKKAEDTPISTPNPGIVPPNFNPNEKTPPLVTPPTIS